METGRGGHEGWRSFKADYQEREAFLTIGTGLTLLGRVESHGQRSADLQKLDEGIDLTSSDLLLALADVLACANAS